MNYQEFIENVQTKMDSLVAPGQKVSIHSIEKNNGTIYQGLVIIDPVLNISPTIYLESFYHKYINGTSFSDICDEILKTYQQFTPTENFDETIFTDYEKAKSRIVMKLVNYQKNHALLEKVPHVPYLDLAIVFVCCASNFEKEYSTILIHKHHMKHWNVDVSTLYDIAKENTPRLLPFHIENMEEYLTKRCDWQPFDELIPMYILSNHLKIHGATVLLYDGLLEEIAKWLNSSFIVLPSSVHEVIIVPVHSKRELSRYTRMVEEVNATQLPIDDILSNHAYYYSKREHVLC